MKRIYSILLALCVSSMLFAQLSVWNGSSDIWTKGAGTEASPYLIESAEQLAFISDMVNGGVTTYENTYFKLMTNIDLGRSAWISISFSGSIDGNNHTIIYSGDQPLFGNFSKGIIKKLNVECTNGFAKSIEGASIIDCTYKGKNTMIKAATNSSIVHCSCSVDIPYSSQKGNQVAGMVNEAEYCKFIACRISGNIVGGFNEHITSWTYGNTESFKKCNIFAAGLVALSQDCKYNQCACNVNVSVRGVSDRTFYIGTTRVKITAYAFAGGIVGLTARDTILNSQVLGTITEESDYDFLGGAGGIAGIQSNYYYESKTSTISNSFTLDSTFCYKVTNGNLARLDQLLTGDYNSVTTSPNIINAYSSKDKTEASMKSASFPIILNTDSTVFIQDKFGVNDGYPIYKEQVYAITNPATDVQLTSANLNASYYALYADSIGFEYKESADKTHWYKRVTIDTISSDYSYKLENLATGTEYTYRFWVAQNGVFYFGEELTFTTQECSTNTYPETATICNGEEYEFANKILTKSGVYYDTLTAVNGCDSVIELTLTVSPVNEIQKYDTIFVGDSYDFFGQILTETGTYTHYVPAGTYCNLVIMNLYVKQPSVVVTATSADKTMGTVEGSGTYEKYSSVTITAIPNEGYRFENWNDGDTNDKRIIVLSSDTTLTAYFQPIKYVITAIANDEKLGTVYGGGEYAYNTSVSLMAVANDGAEFVTWTNGVVENPYIFKAVENMAIQAIFKTIPSGVDDVQVDENTTTKIVQNGQLFIIRDGKTYTVMGQELK